MPLEEGFYQRSNVVAVARDLLGKVLVTRVGNAITTGMIVETEAYSWKERGCHAYGGRKTARNAIMFEKGGHAYVYFCYGMHNMFNVVTNHAGLAEAVLVRAVEPREGIAAMERRRGALKNALHLTSGPGKLTKAMGIDRKLNGKFLRDEEIWLEDSGERITPSRILASERIGIDYAGDDARLPWRFTIKGNIWVSR